MKSKSDRQRFVREVKIHVPQGEKGMTFLQIAKRRFGIAGELVAFFWDNKRWWIVPMIIVLLFTGVLLIFAQSSVIAPFIYTLF